MSDSEIEFESADEGSKDDDGWEIESDFDLDVEPKKIETKTSMLPNVSDLMDTEKYEEKPLDQNNTSVIPTLQSRKDKLIANDGNSNYSKPHNSENNKVVLNEIKPTNTQSTVSMYFYKNCIILRGNINYYILKIMKTNT